MSSKMNEWEQSSAPDVPNRNSLFSVTLWSVLTDLRNYQQNATAETDPARKAQAQKRVDDFNRLKPGLTNRFITLVQNDLFDYADCLDFSRYYNAWIKNTLLPGDPQIANWERRISSIESIAKSTCAQPEINKLSNSSIHFLNLFVFIGFFFIIY